MYADVPSSQVSSELPGKAGRIFSNPVHHGGLRTTSTPGSQRKTTSRTPLCAGQRAAKVRSVCLSCPDINAKGAPYKIPSHLGLEGYLDELRS